MSGVHRFGTVDMGDNASFNEAWEQTVFAIDRIFCALLVREHPRLIWKMFQQTISTKY
jgi:hypothetical protein